jgi:aspartate-semialdehyde dehydrogenase
MEERSFPFTDLQLLDDMSFAGTLTEAGGEPAVIQSIAEDSFERTELVFFTGSPEFTAQNLGVAKRAGANVIDLSGALLDALDAAPWIPALDGLLAPPSPQAASRFFVSPPAAAIVACSLAAALAPLRPQRLVLTVFQPVSERGQEGIEELESQTVNLLSFQPIAQRVYDAQVAFNLLSKFGAGSRVPLEASHGQVARSVSRYLGDRVVVPALQLIHAPVFYSYAFSFFAELKGAPEPADVERALSLAGIQKTAADEAPPNNVNVAGESSIRIAPVERENSVQGGFWIWGSADNLRLAASNAVSIAERLFAS